MSIYAYGDGSTKVTLPYAVTRRFVQEVLYDESDTDWYVTRFDIEVECVINANYLSQIAPDLVVAGRPVTDNAAAIMDVIRTRLSKPRKTLSVQFNGVELIPQKAGVVGTVDAMNGPKPRNCQILQLTNVTFLVVWNVVAHYWENNKTTPTGTPITANRAGAVVLYNRWTESVEIDNANYSTRTREGKFMIRSDNAQGLIADMMRTQMAVVSVPDGFLRVSSNYTQDPNGLAMTYRVVDREVFRTPPVPAFEARGRFSEQTASNGGKTYFTVQLMLRGDKSVDQGALLRTAIAVCFQKVRIETNLNDRNFKGFLLQSCNITQDMYDNIVDVSMQGMRNAPRNNRRIDGVAGLVTDGFDFTPGSPAANPNIPPYLDRGTAGLLLQAAAYYDPSITVTLGAGITGTISPNTPTGATAVQLPGKIPGQAGKFKET